jgi:hypothetical protein
MLDPQDEEGLLQPNESGPSEVYRYPTTSGGGYTTATDGSYYQTSHGGSSSIQTNHNYFQQDQPWIQYANPPAGDCYDQQFYGASPAVTVSGQQFDGMYYGSNYECCDQQYNWGTNLDPRGVVGNGTTNTSNTYLIDSPRHFEANNI